MVYAHAFLFIMHMAKSMGDIGGGMCKGSGDKGIRDTPILAFYTVELKPPSTRRLLAPEARSNVRIITALLT